MAKKPVTFNSGALVQIKIDGTTVAYGQSLNYSMSRNIISPAVLGEYGVPALIPASYNPVSGSIRILKLAPKPALDGRAAESTQQKSMKADTVTDVSVSTSMPQTKKNPIEAASVIGTNENTINSFDPAKVLFSSTFDIEFYLMYPSPDNESIVYQLKTKIVDCRFNSRSVSMAIGDIVGEVVGFQGTILLNYSANNPGGNNEKILEDHYSTDLK